MNQPDQRTTDEENPSPELRPARVEQPRLFEVPQDDSGGPVGPAEVSLLDKVLAFEGESSPIHLTSLLIGSVLILTAASLDLFPWAASAFGLVGVVATMFRGGRWVASLSALAVVLVVVASSWPRGPTLADLNPAGSAAQDQADSIDDAPEGSLGVRLSDLPDLWNALDEPPAISRGFSRSLEQGPLDGFVMRFDEGASLAGAYDPSDDSVYAISTSTRLDHEAATTMYLHLCFLLHPYSQECIDAYWDVGLDGKSPSDYLGSEHSAEWQIGAETWRLAIVGNVQEIKVLGGHPG